MVRQKDLFSLLLLLKKLILITRIILFSPDPSLKCVSALRTLQHQGLLLLSQPPKSWVLGQVQHRNVDFPAASCETNIAKITTQIDVALSLARTQIQQEIKLICKGWTILSQTKMCGRFSSWSAAAGSLSNANRNIWVPDLVTYLFCTAELPTEYAVQLFNLRGYFYKCRKLTLFYRRI